MNRYELQKARIDGENFPADRLVESEAWTTELVTEDGPNKFILDLVTALNAEKLNTDYYWYRVVCHNGSEDKVMSKEVVGQMTPPLTEFERGYIEAMFWTEYGDNDYTVDNLDPDFLAEIRADCNKFYTENEQLLTQAFETMRHPTGERMGVLGQEFWLTRNHHGSGFWDRDDISETVSKALTRAAHTFGEVSLDFDDGGMIYGV